MDIVFIRDLRAPAWIGLYDWEQQRPQTLAFDIDIGLDAHRAGASDSIRDTVDYGKVIERIRADLENARFKLLEALAEHIAELVLRDFAAQWIKISVAKLGHVRGVARVGVTIARSRHGQADPPAEPPAA